MPKKSYLGQPYYGSQKTARIFTSIKGAESYLVKKRKTGDIIQIGNKRLYCVREKGKKYYSK